MPSGTNTVQVRSFRGLLTSGAPAGVMPFATACLMAIIAASFFVTLGFRHSMVNDLLGDCTAVARIGSFNRPTQIRDTRLNPANKNRTVIFDSAQQQKGENHHG